MTKKSHNTLNSRGKRKSAVKPPEFPESWFPSIASASSVSGIPFEVIQHAKASGCGAFSGSRVAGWALVRWLEGKRGGSAKESDAKERLNWKDELAKWKAKAAQLKHEREAKSLMPRADAEETIIAIVESLKATLKQKCVNEWPVKLAMVPADEIAARIDAEVEALYEAMRENARLKT